MNYIKKNFVALFLFVFVLIFPLSLLAQYTGNAPVPPAGSTTINNPLPAIKSIPEFIKIILEFVIKIGIPIVALAIIYSGFLFVSARGKPSELETAKRSIMYTLIGAAILLGAWAIAIMISETVLDLGKTSFIIINNSIS